jgi:hypothetical protein
MDIKTIVSIQPQNVREILTENEINTLMDIADKVINAGEKLELVYYDKPVTS